MSQNQTDCPHDWFFTAARGRCRLCGVTHLFAQSERAINLYLTQNLTLVEVGKIIGCSPEYVRRVLKKAGVPRRKQWKTAHTTTFSNPPPVHSHTGGANTVVKEQRSPRFPESRITPEAPSRTTLRRLQKARSEVESLKHETFATLRDLEIQAEEDQETERVFEAARDRRLRPPQIIQGSVIHLRSCPRCLSGATHTASDLYGEYATCVTCGWCQ